MSVGLHNRMRLAVAQPGRIAPFVYYRSLNFLRDRLRPAGEPEALDDRLLHILDDDKTALQIALAYAAERKEKGRGAGKLLSLKYDEHTYNTAHPGYRPEFVRNYPGRIFNRRHVVDNQAYTALLRMARRDRVPDYLWRSLLLDTAAEIRSIPHAQQILERRRYIETYLAELHRTTGALYQPGWVNLQDAVFLYWLVRQVKPQTILQCGVCNGLSAAFMILALVKNGNGGKLHAIDLPMVYDPSDPAWTVRDQFYHVIIPQGETSGYLVPDAYRDRFDLWTGDARELLPRLVDEIGQIDFFYHDSDHSYGHMMFEFRQATRKLTKGGIVAGDDIAWNASLWDFGDACGVPSYNFKGSIGVAFF